MSVVRAGNVPEINGLDDHQWQDKEVSHLRNKVYYLKNSSLEKTNLTNLDFIYHQHKLKCLLSFYFKRHWNVSIAEYLDRSVFICQDRYHVSWNQRSCFSHGFIIVYLANNLNIICYTYPPFIWPQGCCVLNKHTPISGEFPLSFILSSDTSQHLFLLVLVCGFSLKLRALCWIMGIRLIFHEEELQLACQPEAVILYVQTASVSYRK